MNHLDAAHQKERLALYNKLTELRSDCMAALKTITEDWAEKGPCGQGPFTGNTRESRQIDSMRIMFSATRGGSHPVDMTINTMHLDASDVGSFLAMKLREKIAKLDEQIEKI